MPEVKIEIKGVREGLAKEFADYASSLAASFVSPQAILSRLKAYVQANPELVDAGYWVYLDSNNSPDYDKGFRISLYRRPKWRDLSVGLLLGKSTTGFDLQTPIYKAADGLSFWVGVGVVSPHEDFLKKWYPAVSCSFHIPLSGGAK